MQAFVILIFLLYIPTEINTEVFPQSIRNKTVCMHSRMELDCRGDTLILIKGASFRSSKIYKPNSCKRNSVWTAECETLKMVEQMCNNKRNCKLNVNDYHTMYDHREVINEQYLTVWYKCQIILECEKWEQFRVDAPKCPPTCNPQVYSVLPCGTYPGCECVEGFIRDHFTGLCLSATQCPAGNPMIHDLPETFRRCQRQLREDCDYPCHKPLMNVQDILSPRICKPGYYCSPGYCRPKPYHPCIPC